MDINVRSRRAIVIFVMVSFALLMVSCAPPIPVEPDIRPLTLFNWFPQWSVSNRPDEESRMYLTQGLPGYSLIAGKDTLLAFAPYPPGMNPEKNSAWLDVYKIYSHGIESPFISHLTGAPVVDEKECDSSGNRCAELNFFIAGELLTEPRRYRFVITWTSQNNRQTIDSMDATFNEPPIVKVLWVPIGENLFAPDTQEANMASIRHYVSTMPFPSNVIEHLGSNSAFLDIYPDYVPFGEGWMKDGTLDLDNPIIQYEVISTLIDKRETYNQTAAIKAEFVIGIYNPKSNFPVPSGYSTGWGKVGACTNWPGICTHEIGHLVGMTEEPADSNYTTWKTCGYFYPEDDIDCQDWAYDTIDGSITSGNAQPQNVMYRGSGIFTRHFYEAACIYYHGGCESTQRGIFHLETLATNLYLNGNGHTGQVVIDRLGEAEPAFWDADIVRREHDHTYITLQLHYTRTCNDCPFTLLICNPTTGEVKTTWPEYYFHPNNSQEFIGWKHEWVVDQIADGIVTLECGPFDDSFLKWEPSVSRPILAVPSKPDQEHWTSHFQWRINR